MNTGMFYMRNMLGSLVNHLKLNNSNKKDKTPFFKYLLKIINIKDIFYNKYYNYLWTIN